MRHGSGGATALPGGGDRRRVRIIRVVGLLEAMALVDIEASGGGGRQQVDSEVAVASPCPWATGRARVVVLDERMKNEEGGRSSHALTKNKEGEDWRGRALGLPRTRLHVRLTLLQVMC
jgi:hypothetical protein